jgi:hypothetical protein
MEFSRGPGPLHTAGRPLPPPWPVLHPFVSMNLFSAEDGDSIDRILRTSVSFDDFVARLEADRFEVARYPESAR